jgi:hypothetical protein
MAAVVVGYRWDDGKITEHAVVIAFLAMLAGGAIQSFIDIGRVVDRHDALLKSRGFHDAGLHVDE